MEEKKKRWRPTVTAYRALEKELKAVKDAYKEQLAADEHLSEKVKGYKAKLITLEQSNKLMEEEMARLRQYSDEYFERYISISKKYKSVMRRGFWARVFNKV